MKKRFLTLFILFFTCSVFGAQYKINSKGQVVAPNGNIQRESSIINNYYADTYTPSNISSSGISVVDIVMDYSGSMYYWIETAKKAMRGIVSNVPSDINLGFRVFGNNDGNIPYDPVLSKVKSVVDKNQGHALQHQAL